MHQQWSGDGVIPWNWCYTGMWATMWALGTESRVLCRKGYLNCWAISPAEYTFYRPFLPLASCHSEGVSTFSSSLIYFSFLHLGRQRCIWLPSSWKRGAQKVFNINHCSDSSSTNSAKGYRVLYKCQTLRNPERESQVSILKKNQNLNKIKAAH